MSCIDEIRMLPGLSQTTPLNANPKSKNRLVDWHAARKLIKPAVKVLGDGLGLGALVRLIERLGLEGRAVDS